MSSRSPKVALYDPSGSGGITHYTFELAEGLIGAGCPVTVVTSEGYELENVGRRFDVWFLIKKSWIKSWVSRARSLTGRRAELAGPSQKEGPGETRKTFTGRLLDQLKSLRFTAILFKAAVVLALNGTRVVHVQWIIDRRADLRFMRLLRWMGMTLVYTVHDPLPHDADTADNRRFYRKLYRYPHTLIVHSEHDRGKMMVLFGIARDRLRVIPHGCQSVLFDHFGSSTLTARRELHISDTARVILFFGLIRRYKGLEYLLQAFETVRSGCDDVVLLVAGQIGESDPEVHRHYSTLLEQYAGRGDIRFTNNYVPVDQVSRFFAAADVVVLPYVKASQSGVLLSAYAAGKPVVVTHTGGLSEVVSAGRSGLVVPPKNAGALAEALLSILNDPGLASRFGAEARLLAETTYSWSAIGRATATLYRSLLDAASSAALDEADRASVGL